MPVERAIWLVRYFARAGVSVLYQPRPEPGAQAPGPAGARPFGRRECQRRAGEAVAVRDGGRDSS